MFICDFIAIEKKKIDIKSTLIPFGCRQDIPPKLWIKYCTVYYTNTVEILYFSSIIRNKTVWLITSIILTNTWRSN